MRNAFTIVELIIVIAILGILATIAIPKFTDTVEDAYISKAQAKVDTIRSGLQNYRSKHLMIGDWTGSYPSLVNGTELFGAVAEKVQAGTSAGTWQANNTGTRFTYHTGEHDIVFDYNATTGKFECSSPADICKRF
jgi:prepilin-type N-terminal cleavage/methylation domain-containing protein